MGMSMENEPAVKKKLLMVKAIIAGLLLAALSWGLGRIAEGYGFDWMEDNGDALVIGLLGGFIFYRLFLQDAVIREVNHHVRNALQVMLYAENAGDVRDALKRIDWTLRKVIRGKFETSYTEEEEAAVRAKDMSGRVVR